MTKHIIVQKFGGSSVKDVERMKAVAKRIVASKKRNNNIVVVVSAMGKTTDKLEELAFNISKNPKEREMDILMSTGELASSALLAMAVTEAGHDAIALSGSQIGVKTEGQHLKSKIDTINGARIRAAHRDNKIVIVAGYQGINKNEDITTLGRGGSDLSAVALAVALKAKMCEIYTDVTGIFTTDPRKVKNARKIQYITFDEMLEMASLGAGVMQARSIEVAKRFNMPIHVRSSYHKEEGTMIVEDSPKIEEIAVRGVTSNAKEAKITINSVPDRAGIAAKIFSGVSKKGANVDLIVQNISHTGLTDISFTVPRGQLSKALAGAREVAKKIKAGNVIADDKIARVSIVGSGMRSHEGIAAKMFETLAKAKINIEMISTSEISISCIISDKQTTKAMQALHKAFELDKIKKYTA